MVKKRVSKKAPNIPAKALVDPAHKPRIVPGRKGGGYSRKNAPKPDPAANGKDDPPPE